MPLRDFLSLLDLELPLDLTAIPAKLEVETDEEVWAAMTADSPNAVE